MKLKRFLYVPGMISLLGLPLLLMIFPIREREIYTSFRIFIPNDKKDVLSYSKYGVFQSIGKKKITSIDLSQNEDYFDMESIENNYFFKQRFKFIINEIERLAFTHDTSTVLKVSLGNENTLGDFVRLSNIATLYQIKRYPFVDNDFYFFANPPPAPPEAFIADSVYGPIVIPGWKAPSFWEIQEQKFQETVRVLGMYLHGNYLLTIGFILLIAVPTFIRIRKPAW